MVEYTISKTRSDYEQILQLQQSNLKRNLATPNVQLEGYVTVEHTLNQLINLATSWPHILVKEECKVIAYALVMLRSARKTIPVLVSMFDKIDHLLLENTHLGLDNYFVMGQICIAKEHRRMGLFNGLYTSLCQQMSSNFDVIFTEIALDNTRSLNAHLHFGFKILYSFEDGDHKWHIVYLDMRKMGFKNEWAVQ